MQNDLNFETFLFFGPKKIILSVNQRKNFKQIFKKEILIDDYSNKLNFEKLNNFLNENIFKIEKILDSFIKSINIAVFSEDIFTLKISVKKNNHNEKIHKSTLIYLLNDAKDYCKKSMQNKKIIHFLIDNFLVDNSFYKELPTNIKCENFSLDLSFICLPDVIVKNIERILENYQISVNKFLSASYVEEYSTRENLDFFQCMSNIIEGSNPNEVKLVQKILKNKGFFEKFFDFFS